MTKIVLATGNKHKSLELKHIAEGFKLVLLSPEESRTEYVLPPPPTVDESGATFLENARLKSRAFADWSGLPSLGDDSGLEVEALDGGPGIHSARYGGAGLTDSQRCERLLSALQSVPKENRKARFFCQLVLSYPGTDRELTASGILEGEVLQEFAGHGGFGYDPIVYIYQLGQTLAETDFDTTCRQGFRAIAAQKLFNQLRLANS